MQICCFPCESIEFLSSTAVIVYTVDVKALYTCQSKYFKPYKRHFSLISRREGDLVDYNGVGSRDRGLLRNQLHWLRPGNDCLSLEILDGESIEAGEAPFKSSLTPLPNGISILADNRGK